MSTKCVFQYSMSLLVIIVVGSSVFLIGKALDDKKKGKNRYSCDQGLGDYDKEEISMRKKKSALYTKTGDALSFINYFAVLLALIMILTVEILLDCIVEILIKEDSNNKTVKTIKNFFEQVIKALQVYIMEKGDLKMTGLLKCLGIRLLLFCNAIDRLIDNSVTKEHFVA